MAENVNITPGAGAVVATDEVSINAVNVQVQRVKLVDSFEGSGGELSKREDVPHVSGDPGFQLLAVRKDTAAALAGTDGDYAPLEVDASGRLWVNVGSMPGAVRTTDSHSAALATDAIMNNLTALTPKWAAVSASTSGNNTLVAAVASKVIRVVAVALIANGTVNAKFQSGAGGTDKTGLFYLAANTGFVLPFNPTGWFETASNTLLNLNLSAAVAVGGVLEYIEV